MSTNEIAQSGWLLKQRRFREKIGVNKYTYRSWESGAAMMKR